MSASSWVGPNRVLRTKDGAGSQLRHHFICASHQRMYITFEL